MTAHQARLPIDPPRPRFPDLIMLDRRLCRLSLSGADQDVQLIAEVLRYVDELNREIDRIRPPVKQPLPWDPDA